MIELSKASKFVCYLDLARKSFVRLFKQRHFHDTEDEKEIMVIKYVRNKTTSITRCGKQFVVAPIE